MLEQARIMGITKKYNMKRLWYLGDIDNCVKVYPHYFGKIKLKVKNHKTRFFITSIIGREYKFLIEAFKRLKEEKYNFEIYSTGLYETFSYNILPKILQDNNTIKFNYKISYCNLFKEINASDYIIINLDPNVPDNHKFKNVQCMGSAQISYGFLKPSIINRDFANFYCMNSENSFLYDNSYLYEILSNGILLNNKQYKKIQSNLIKSSNKIYNVSMGNIKRALYNH